MAAVLLDKPIGIRNSQLTLGQHVPSSIVCNASQPCSSHHLFNPCVECAGKKHSENENPNR